MQTYIWHNLQLEAPFYVLWFFSLKSQHAFLQVFNTSLAEPTPDGYEDVSDIVPPYSAYSAQGQPEVKTCTRSNMRYLANSSWYLLNISYLLNERSTHDLCLLPQGDLVYVNYGRTEDFFQLERDMGINVAGKIVIARYGKIFRGNKVWKLSLNFTGCLLCAQHFFFFFFFKFVHLCCSTRWRTPCQLEPWASSCSPTQLITVHLEFMCVSVCASDPLLILSSVAKSLWLALEWGLD